MKSKLQNQEKIDCVETGGHPPAGGLRYSPRVETQNVASTPKGGQDKKIKNRELEEFAEKFSEKITDTALSFVCLSRCQSPRRHQELAVRNGPEGKRLIKTFIDMLMKE